MFGDLNPLVTGLVVFVVLAASIVIVVSLALSHRGLHLPHLPHLPIHDKEPEVALPSGADAALWSIVEAVPDPRNHLVLTRDLSGEVHITAADRDAAAALFGERPTTERIASPPPERDAIAALFGERPNTQRIAPSAPVVFTTVEDTQDEERLTEEDKLVRTGEFFFAGEPRLNRF